MALFEFKDDSLLLGTVREVDTRQVSIYVKTDEDLRKAKVGQLVALRVTSAVEIWLIGFIDKVVKFVSIPNNQNNVDINVEEGGIEERREGGIEERREDVINNVKLTLVGTAKWDAIKRQYTFSRSLVQVPDIASKCYVLVDQQLEFFMNLLVTSGDKLHSLALGKYTLDDSATAYLDGNKFFQRHAALLGSTGSGKSWTVAAILEQAAKLPTSNLIVFDLHGEYRKLS